MQPEQPKGRLSAEFAGVFSLETIAECLAESEAALRDEARIDVYVDVMAERFARERLRAAAQVRERS